MMFSAKKETVHIFPIFPRNFFVFGMIPLTGHNDHMCEDKSSYLAVKRKVDVEQQFKEIDACGQHFINIYHISNILLEINK